MNREDMLLQKLNEVGCDKVPKSAVYNFIMGDDAALDSYTGDRQPPTGGSGVMNPGNMKDRAIEFIQEYQNGEYGHKVKGEAKALMFSQATKTQDKRQLSKLLDACEDALIEVSYLHIIPGLKWCWVSQNGWIYYCGFGEHCRVAEGVFFQNEAMFERSHAKITETTRTIEGAIAYMDQKPSKRLLEIIDEVLHLRERSV